MTVAAFFAALIRGSWPTRALDKSHARRSGECRLVSILAFPLTRKLGRLDSPTLYPSPGWRNWQTRKLEVLVPVMGVLVRLQSRAFPPLDATRDTLFEPHRRVVDVHSCVGEKRGERPFAPV